MNRRRFLHTVSAAGSATGLARAAIPEHNWEKYDWGAGPKVKDRLYQGPFPQYSPDAMVPDSDVVMVTTPSKEVVPNYGMGLVVYVPVTRDHHGSQARHWRSRSKTWCEYRSRRRFTSAPTGGKSKGRPENWISRIGGRSLSTWLSGITSGSAFVSCWRIPIPRTRGCLNSS
jgi:hypothetical protein